MRGATIRFSLLLKLTVLAAAAAAATIGVFSLSGHVLFENAREKHAERIGHLTRLAVRAVLHDPSPQSLSKISAELGVDIRYADATLQIATADAMPHFSEVQPLRHARRHVHHRWHHRPHRPHRRGVFPRELSLVRHGGGIFLRYDDGQRRALISLDDGDVWELLPFVTLGAVGALLLIWGGVYFLLRRELLAPLAALRRDMEKVGGGEWRECRPHRNDELGRLARGFNDMQARLRTLLTARERFLLAASHELRSPLARLKLAAELLPREKDKAKNAALTAVIARELKELEMLTADLLQHARLQSDYAGARLARVDVAPWLRAVAAARAPQEQAKLSLSLQEGSIALIDKTLLARALHNLLDNAFKYAGGRVEIHLAAGADGDALANGGAQITVLDDGPGVTEKSLPLLFEPFYRADESRARDTGGFGLGLALVAATVKAHGGAIKAENRRGDAPGDDTRSGGFAVIITLPLAE